MSTKERHSLALPAREMQCSVNSVLSVFSPDHLRRELSRCTCAILSESGISRTGAGKLVLERKLLEQIPAAGNAIVQLVAKRIGCTARQYFGNRRQFRKKFDIRIFKTAK